VFGPRKFHEFATQGSSMATARLERADLDAMTAALNREFGLSLVAPEDLYDRTLRGLRVAAGHFWDEKQTVEKPVVARRLKKAGDAARYLEALLTNSSGLTDLHDEAARQLLKEALDVACSSSSAEDRDRQLEVMQAVVGNIGLLSEAAYATLGQMRDKRGQRGLAWYSSFFDVVLDVAQTLQVKLTTAGDRKNDAHRTPLTVIARTLERSLPRDAQAKTFAGSAKRVQEALAKRKAPRGNSFGKK
jgi:hypothetical protein